MVLSILFLVLVLLGFMYLIFLQTKNLKNVGQKISFIYNQLYILLINSYYNTNNTQIKDLLIGEISDYYKNVVKEKDVREKYDKGKEVKGFILQYYNNNDIVVRLYDLIDLYYKQFYYSTQKSIVILRYFSLIILVIILVLLYKINK